MQARAISIPRGSSGLNAFRDALAADFSGLVHLLYGTPERSRRTLWIAVAAMTFGIFIDIQQSAASAIGGCAVSAM